MTEALKAGYRHIDTARMSVMHSHFECNFREC